VDVPVEQDELARGEGRLYDLRHQLRPRRQVQKKLRERRHRRVLAAEQYAADLLADGGAARFPGSYDVDALASQVRRGALELRRLTGALDALECYELPSGHKYDGA